MPSLIRKEELLVNIVEPKLQNNPFTSQEKMFNWNAFLYLVSQHFHIVQEDLSYHVAKKHSVPRSSKTNKCKLCHAEIPGYYALRQHKTLNIEHKWVSQRAIFMRRI